MAYVLERTKLEVGPVEDAGGWMECITTQTFLLVLVCFRGKSLPTPMSQTSEAVFAFVISTRLIREIDLCKVFSIHGATHDRARLANGFASCFDAEDMNCFFNLCCFA